MDVPLSCLVIFVRSIIGSLRMLEGFLLEQIWTFRKGCKFWHRIVAVCGAHFLNLSHVQNALAICKDFRWPRAQVSSSASHSVICWLLKRTCGWRPQVLRKSASLQVRKSASPQVCMWCFAVTFIAVLVVCSPLFFFPFFAFVCFASICSESRQ